MPVNKYIVEDDCIVMAKCDYHKQLVIDNTKVQGGGMFTLDTKKKTIIFYGDSYKFGGVDKEDMQRAVNDKKIYMGRKRKKFPYTEYKLIIIFNKEHIKLN